MVPLTPSTVITVLSVGLLPGYAIDLLIIVLRFSFGVSWLKDPYINRLKS